MCGKGQARRRFAKRIGHVMRQRTGASAAKAIKAGLIKASRVRDGRDHMTYADVVKAIREIFPKIPTKDK